MFLTVHTWWHSRCLFSLSPTQQSTYKCYDPKPYKKTERKNYQAIIKTGGTKSEQSQHQMNMPQLQVTWQSKTVMLSSVSTVLSFCSFWGYNLGVLECWNMSKWTSKKQLRSWEMQTPEQKGWALFSLYLQPWEKLSNRNADHWQLSKDDTRDLDLSQCKNLK